VVLFFGSIVARYGNARDNDEKSSMKKKNVVLEQKRCNTTGKEGYTLKCVVASYVK
jgi:hypothetical protein